MILECKIVCHLSSDGKPASDRAGQARAVRAVTVQCSVFHRISLRLIGLGVKTGHPVEK
jgi:hypothetical protein